MVTFVITLVVMGVELVGGHIFGSMAVLADGLHMGSHALALGLAAIAYVYARRHAHDPRFCFGTGKVIEIAGFAGAFSLGGFSLLMAVESVQRLVSPVTISFGPAIAVAAGGLLTNLVCLSVLGHAHDDHHRHTHDHNLRAAYLHVLADALTSILAIAALLAGQFAGWTWLDPTMGIVGAALVASWAWGLLKETVGVLLDRQQTEICEQVREAVEVAGTTVLDLHVWAIGPQIHSAALVVADPQPQPPDVYRQRLPDDAGIVHVTIEVREAAS
jgi:cation diffusion facilitator family transporter